MHKFFSLPASVLIGSRALICIIIVVLFPSNHTVYECLNSEWLTDFMTQSEHNVWQHCGALIAAMKSSFREEHRYGAEARPVKWVPSGRSTARCGGLRHVGGGGARNHPSSPPSPQLFWASSFLSPLKIGGKGGGAHSSTEKLLHPTAGGIVV